MKPAMSRAATWRSNTAGRKINTTDLPALAADLVRRQVAVIVANSHRRDAGGQGGDRNDSDRLRDRRRPGPARTCRQPQPAGRQPHGRDHLNVEVGPKRLELLHELVPAATVIAAARQPDQSQYAEPITRNLQAAARTLGLQLHVLHASTERDIDAVFATLVQLRAGALVIGADPFFVSRSEQLAALALRHAVPAIYPYSRVRRGRRPDELRRQHYGRVSVWSASTPAASSRARSRPTCRSSRPRRSSWSSTSRPPRRSASPSRSRCSAAPTR